LHNGENVVLQWLAGELTLNSDWFMARPHPELGEVALHHTLRRIQAPLLYLSDEEAKDAPPALQHTGGE
ncbi:MAG: hypothetical protein ACRDI2_18420, partial [Chloroflexota bacterium]